jgi:Zn-dependent protease
LNPLQWKHNCTTISVAGFSIIGIRIRIDQSWFIAFLLFAWTLSAGYFPLQAPNYPASAYWIFGTLSALGLFASVLIHELSHSVVALKLGIPVRQITLFIFGGVSEMTQSESNSPGSEFRITIAGPAASVALGIILGVFYYTLGPRIDRLPAETLQYLVFVNFLLAAFNLIPGFPLDGGRILRSYLWYRSGDFGKATRSAARIGGGFATVMIGIGLFGILTMHFMFGIWLLLIGLFLKKSAEGEYRSYQMRTSLEHLTVRDIMVPPVAVEKGTTVEEFINGYVFHYHDRVFPVVDHGRFIGMIDLNKVKKVPVHDWPNTYIDAYISDSSEYCVLEPQTDARDALRLLIDCRMPKAAVVSNDALVGFLTRNDLLEVISLKSDLAA